METHADFITTFFHNKFCRQFSMEKKRELCLILKQHNGLLNLNQQKQKQMHFEYNKSCPNCIIMHFLQNFM
jgi:hypothetical protein